MVPSNEKGVLMSKPAEIELAQLKTALNYLVGLLEEGSLVARYDKSTREEIATVLQLTMSKTADLPPTVPENLVQAAAVRALIGASEKYTQIEQSAQQEHLARQKREIEASASINGHSLGDWEQVPGSDLEYQATCTVCGGFVYISKASTYDLLTDNCNRMGND
jgi:hypothetical protein